jgi:Protein of unknown function (DUF3107)
MTLLQMTGGKEIAVSLSYDEIRDLLQKALTERQLLELRRHDGTVVLINPANVTYIQNTTGEGPGPAHEAHSREEAPA